MRTGVFDARLNLVRTLNSLSKTHSFLIKMVKLADFFFRQNTLNMLYSVYSQRAYHEITAICKSLCLILPQNRERERRISVPMWT